MISANLPNGKCTVAYSIQDNQMMMLLSDKGNGMEIRCFRDIPKLDDFTKSYLADAEKGINNNVLPEEGTISSRHLSIMPNRMEFALSYITPKLHHLTGWLLSSRETSNYTYDLTERNLNHLANLVSIVTGVDQIKIRSYLHEPSEDTELEAHLRRVVAGHPLQFYTDEAPFFGRRLGWYAFVRATRPAVVIETGVDKGLGSTLLCAALRRNRDEGHQGEYFGTDINPNAGFLLSGPYAEVGKILYGDSIESLKTFDKPINLFINDSDHSSTYEREEYRIIQSKLAPGAIVLGDNSHCSDALMEFSQETNRHFVFFREEPRDHWYPGAGIGISY